MTILYRSSGIWLSIGYLIMKSFWINMPIQVEWGFCLVLLGSLGIPHGAADHLVAGQLAVANKKSFSIYSFILKYVLVMLGYGILWHFFPLVSFIIFIGISVFHFGELETTFTTKKSDSGVVYLVQQIRSLILGIGILGFMLSQHAMEVSIILQNFNLGIPAPMDVLPVGFYIICMLLGFQKEHTTYFIHTAITLIIGTFIPILPAFMCYFAGCHSVYSLRLLATSLKFSLGQLYVKLLPFTIVALLMGATYVYFVNQEKWLAHSFIFLSILTLPHFFLMHKISSQMPE